MKIDLHCHTTASDGRLSPQQLVDRALEFDIGKLAITDHDTVAGSVAAKQYIIDEGLPIELISGIEVSTLWQNKDIHVVGLGIDTEHEAIRELVALQARTRATRAALIAHRLAKVTLARQGGEETADDNQADPQDLDDGELTIHGEKLLAEVQAIAGEAAVTRSHFAKWLVDNGYCKTVQQVFKRYLTRNNPGYVPPMWCDMRTAIDAIHTAGGIAVLAHPGRYDLTAKWIKRLLKAFSEAGGDAMEIALPQQSQQERRTLADYAIQYNLLASMGSDFHYPSPWTELGRNLWLPDGLSPVWESAPLD